MHVLCLPGGAHAHTVPMGLLAGAVCALPGTLCLLFIARRLVMLQAAAARPPLQSASEVGAVCGTPCGWLWDARLPDRGMGTGSGQAFGAYLLLACVKGGFYFGLLPRLKCVA